MRIWNFSYSRTQTHPCRFYLGIGIAQFANILTSRSSRESMQLSELQTDWNDTCKPNFEAFVEADTQVVIPSPP